MALAAVEDTAAVAPPTGEELPAEALAVQAVKPANTKIVTAMESLRHAQRIPVLLPLHGEPKSYLELEKPPHPQNLSAR